MSRRQPKPQSIQPCPEIQALIEKREALEAQLEDLEGQIEMLDVEAAPLVLRLVTENQGETNYLSEGRLSELEADDLVLGHHECSGPLGRCVYDEVADPAHDLCVFCGDPEERK